MEKITKLLVGFIVISAATGFFLTACGEKPAKEKILSGTVTADTEGIVSFMYSRSHRDNPESCTFSTNLPSPNDQFIVTIVSGESTGKKVIDGLTAGQKVEWKATVAGNPLNHGSNNFVHIIND